MTDPRPKRAILAALSTIPDFSSLAILPSLDTKHGREVLRWLDWSGLSLTFFRQLGNHDVTQKISADWRQALGKRLAQNLERMHDMLGEVQRLNSAFRSSGVTAALLKGFTLTPDFCEHPSLRHQTDFDFLVDPRSVRAAANVLRSCGYSAHQLNENGETCFTTPLQHVPSAKDNLYSLQRHRQVDLHTSIWEPCSWLPLDVPTRCLESAHPQIIFETEYLALALEDRFLLQVLHAFRHSFRFWIRVSWLLEIANCLENHREDADLWARVIEHAGNTALMKYIFAFVLGLVNRLFRTPIPEPLRSWTAASFTLPLRTWLDHFGVEWAISDWPGSLNNLFLSAEFIPDPNLRRQYLRSRLFPRKENAMMGSVSPASSTGFFLLQATRLSYLAHRAAVHLKGIADLPRQQFRWKRALQSTARLGFESNY